MFHGVDVPALISTHFVVSYGPQNGDSFACVLPVVPCRGRHRTSLACCSTCDPQCSSGIDAHGTEERERKRNRHGELLHLGVEEVAVVEAVGIEDRGDLAEVLVDGEHGSPRYERTAGARYEDSVEVARVVEPRTVDVVLRPGHPATVQLRHRTVHNNTN